MRWIVVALSLALATPAWAQTERTGVIRGVVVDEDGPIEGVTVIATSPALYGTPSVSEFTDEYGRYLLPYLQPGTYEVLFFYGAKRRRSEVQVAANGTTVVNARIDSGLKAWVLVVPLGSRMVVVHEDRSAWGAQPRAPVTVAVRGSATTDGLGVEAEVATVASLLVRAAGAGVTLALGRKFALARWLFLTPAVGLAFPYDELPPDGPLLEVAVELRWRWLSARVLTGLAYDAGPEGKPYAGVAIGYLLR